MKRILVLILAVMCLAMVMAVPVSAEKTDPLADAFQSTLAMLGRWEDFEYDEYYMVKQISWEICGSESQVTVPAAEYEAVLNKHFAIDDTTLEIIRNWEYTYLLEYNEAEGTYAVYRAGGTSIDYPADRDYLGYINNGETYDVFYQHKTLEYLSNKFDSYREFSAYVDDLGWPSSIEYEGVVYELYMDLYYSIASYDNYGKKFTVEYNDGIVRIISCADYTEEDLPDSFDDTIPEDEVIYDLPANGAVTIPENECFEGNTTVKVEALESGDIYNAVAEAMKEIAEKYAAYEFTALKDGESVQPDGKLTVTFAIPAGYSNDVAVYYMTPDGTLEKLASTVDSEARTVTAELEHFSTYIVVDNASEPKLDDTAINPGTGDLLMPFAWMLLICVVACVTTVTVSRKRSN